MQTYGDAIVSIGACTWGVDYVRCADDLTPLADPVGYRDRRPRVALPVPSVVTSWGSRHSITAVQHRFQLETEPDLARTAHLLTIPDYLHAWLSGRPSHEWTNASTTGLARPNGCGWSHDLIQQAGLPHQLFGQVVWRNRSGPLCTHGSSCPLSLWYHPDDTAAAMAALPTDDRHAAFVSCSASRSVRRLINRADLRPAVRRWLLQRLARDGRLALAEYHGALGPQGARLLDGCLRSGP